MRIAGLRVVVVGFGRSGAAAARLLVERGAGVRVVDTSADASTREEALRLARQGVSFECGPHRPGQAEGADLVVVSPGVPPSVAPVREAQDRGVPVIGEIELGARLARGRLLAITGSNGKSTTVTVAARILAAAGFRVQAGGNLGRPLCDIVREDDAPEAVHCLELSSFQCETLDRARFDVVAILNVSPNHLDRYPSIEAYAAAKLHLLDQQGPGGVAVLNADDPVVAAGALRARGRVAWFGRAPLPGIGVGLEGSMAVSTLPDAAGPLLSSADLWTPAPHHVANVLAAAAVALSAGAPTIAVSAGLAGFAGLPHRSELVPTLRGPRFINDSKATSVAAAVAAIEGAGRGAVVILGGRHKGGDLAGLRDALVAAGDRAVLLGEAAEVLDRLLVGGVPVTVAATLGQAVELAAAQAGPGGTVLLAPACASFDMFRDFEDRGDRFRVEVWSRFGAPGGEGGRGAAGGGFAA